MLSERKTLKQRFGHWLHEESPFGARSIDVLRLEFNNWLVRTRYRISPLARMALAALRTQSGLLANIGCGPFGRPGWVNIDLFFLSGVTLQWDCRNSLPFANGSCKGIHAEHFFEHLDHEKERMRFLRECKRSLQPGGVLRIIVPDAKLYIEGYMSPGWDQLQSITCGRDDPVVAFRTKMDVLNQIFLQGHEHFGGYDEESLTLVLTRAGFSNIERHVFGTGAFPGSPIDREFHAPYSLYIEATA
jgi:predicted SAM-dependent methyltransferase